MALPNDKISTTLVANTLGTSSRDVGTLCTHQAINKWSKWKPIRVKTNGNPLTEQDIVNNKYGFNHSLYDFPTIKEAVEFGTSYIKPNDDSGYRIGDFRGYNHEAIPPYKTQLSRQFNVDFVNFIDFASTSQLYNYGQNVEIPSDGVYNTDVLYNAVGFYADKEMNNFLGYQTSSDDLNISPPYTIRIRPEDFPRDAKYYYLCLAANDSLGFKTTEFDNQFLPMLFSDIERSGNGIEITTGFPGTITIIAVRTPGGVWQTNNSASNPLWLDDSGTIEFKLNVTSTSSRSISLINGWEAVARPTLATGVAVPFRGTGYVNSYGGGTIGAGQTAEIITSAQNLMRYYESNDYQEMDSFEGSINVSLYFNRKLMASNSSLYIYYNK